MQEYRVRIDSDYVEFVPGKTRLKFSTVSGHSLLIAVLLGVLLIVLVGATGRFLVEMVRSIELDTPTSTARRSVEGMVERCTITQGKYSRDIIVTFRYEFRDQTYRYSNRLPAETCELYTQGDLISVFVHIYDPGFARLNGQEYESRSAIVVAITSVILTGACAGIVAGFFPAWRRFKRLNSPHTQLIEGRVTRNVRDVEYSWHLFGREYHSVTIEYRFTNPTGRELKGENKTRDWYEITRYARVRPNAIVTVLYADDGAFVVL